MIIFTAEKEKRDSPISMLGRGMGRHGLSLG
jgi:hypothetical protein